MKEAITAILMIIQLNLFGQNVNVKFVQMNCENNGGDTRERFISVYKGDNIIVTHPKIRFGEFSLNNLEVGEYRILFTNIFGQEIADKVEIDSTTKEIRICIDRFEETREVTLFSQLQESDKLEIIYSSTGCSHWDNERIKFYNKKGKWYFDYFVNNKKIKSNKLSKSDLNELIEFEKRLRQMKNSMGGCTTIDEFTFELNGKRQLQITDDSCDWNGYFKMKRRIIGIKK